MVRHEYSKVGWDVTWQFSYRVLGYNDALVYPLVIVDYNVAVAAVGCESRHVLVTVGHFHLATFLLEVTSTQIVYFAFSNQ